MVLPRLASSEVSELSPPIDLWQVEEEYEVTEELEEEDEGTEEVTDGEDEETDEEVEEEGYVSLPAF